MHRCSSRAGFTLIELMVVIAVIGILVAILFPVFSTAREKARQTKCQAQLMQLVTALNEFHADKGHYPFAVEQPSGEVVGVWYDDVTDPANPRYEGGFSALYPDYVTDRNLFICPDDRDALQNLGVSRDRVYCSYNGLIDWGTGNFLTLDSGGAAILYNYYGYTYEYELDPTDPERINEIAAGSGWSSGYDTELDGCILPARVQGPPATPDLSWLDIYLADGTSGSNGIPDFLDKAQLSWQHFPRLLNRGAPDYTIVTHCPHHRKYYDNPDKKMDVIATLGGQTSLANITPLGDPNVSGVPAGAGSAVAGWVHQNF